MLINWPAKFEPLVMKHIWEVRTKQVELVDRRYRIIERAYNSHHHTTAVTKEEFTWGYVTVKSRSVNWATPLDKPDWFAPAKTKDGRVYCSAMAPVIDMFNHGQKPNCRWEATGSPVSTNMIAIKDVAVGEELLVDYG